MEKKPDEPKAVKTEDLTYNDYLKVPELLALQVPQSDPAHHDEMLFIIIHQAYELWFKLMIHELEFAKEFMGKANVLRARHFVHRCVEILKVLVKQIHILETMEPAEFLRFRDKLNPASGFQSMQFREIEFMVGLKERRYLMFFKSRPDLVAKLEKRLNEPDLSDAFYGMLKKLGHKVETPEESLATLKVIYEKPDGNIALYLLAESLIEFDQYLGLWREHHVGVVERIIGAKTGTGGSSGVNYLRSTLGKRAFPLLWEVRTVLEKT